MAVRAAAAALALGEAAAVLAPEAGPKARSMPMAGTHATNAVPMSR